MADNDTDAKKLYEGLGLNDRQIRVVEDTVKRLGDISGLAPFDKPAVRRYVATTVKKEETKDPSFLDTVEISSPQPTPNTPVQTDYQPARS